MHLSQIALLAAILLFSPQSEVTATPLAGRPGAEEADEELGAGLQRRDSEPAQPASKDLIKEAPIKSRRHPLAHDQAKKWVLKSPQTTAAAPVRKELAKPALVRRGAYSPQNAYKPSKPNAYTRPSYSDESESDESDSDEDSDASDEESDEDSEDDSDEESEDESDEESEDETEDESGDETEDESDDESDDDESDDASDYESDDGSEYEYEYEETTEESSEETTEETSEETTTTTTYSRN